MIRTTRDNPLRQENGAVEFDLCGVAVRLLNATASHATEFVRRLGVRDGNFRPVEADSPRADLVVRFEDVGSTSEPLRFVGQRDVGFCPDAWHLVSGSTYGSGSTGSPERIQIRLEDNRCEFRVPATGAFPNIPLLSEMLAAVSAARGLLPLHASAFKYNGLGAVVVGFAHGAKTTGMLGFVRNGAEFLSDDSVLVDADGRLFGVGSAISVSDWHLRHVPELRRAVPARKRLPIQAGAALARTFPGLLPGYRHGGGFVCRGLRKLGGSLEGRSTSVSASQWPGSAVQDSAPVTLDRAFISITHNSSEVAVERMDPDAFARWAVRSTMEDLSPLTDARERHRVAFPQRSCPLIDALEERLHSAALSCFSGRELFAVQHPYPVSPQSLFEAMLPVF